MSTTLYQEYITTRIFYAFAALLGFSGLIYFSLQKNILLVLISFAILFVALDNFFCGNHLKKTGAKVCTHYVVPPFLKFKRKNKSNKR